MKKSNFFLLLLVIFMIPITSFKAIDKQDYVCVSSYRILNSTSDKLITNTYLAANWTSLTFPYSPGTNSYNLTTPIIPSGGMYDFTLTNPYEYATPQNTQFFTCQFDTHESFQGVIDLYHNGILVKTITDPSPTTHHTLVYKNVYDCKSVLIVFHE